MEIDWDTADAKNASILVSSAVGFARGSFNFGLFDQGMKELKAALKFLLKEPPSPTRTRLVKKVRDMATYGRRMMDLSGQNKSDIGGSGLGDPAKVGKRKTAKRAETEEQRDMRLARALRSILVDRSGNDEWERVNPHKLMQFLDFGDDLEASADMVDGHGCEPGDFLE